jgi:WD40 repeat protein
LQKLKRDRLEAVWERFSIEEAGLGAIDLHPKGRRLLYCAGNQAYLALDQDGGALSVWKASRPDPILLVRFVQSGEESLVLTVEETGRAALHNPADGSLDEFSLDGGPLSQVMLHGSTLTFLGRNAGLGQYDLADGSYFFREIGELIPQLQGQDYRFGIAPWQKGKVLATTSESLGIIDLGQPGSPIQPLHLGLAITKVPCFMEHLPERGLLVLGFSSGTLRILDVNGAGILAALPHGEGNLVTSFELLAELGVAVTTTARGQITFWDLRTQQPLDEFVVHHNGVSQLRASHSGRYLLTAENGGIIRYWETSWTGGELRGKGNDISWPSKRKSVGRFSHLLGGLG